MQLKQEGTRVIAASSGTTSRLESSIEMTSQVPKDSQSIHFPIGEFINSQ